MSPLPNPSAPDPAPRAATVTSTPEPPATSPSKKQPKTPTTPENVVKQFRNHPTHLDLSRVTLHVFQPYVIDSYVDSMVRGIEHGDNFDPVPVLRLDDRTYALVPDVKNSEGITDGGHHRAAAHYVTNQPLPIRILEPALQSNRFRDCKTGADMVRVLTSQPPPDGQRYTYHDPEDLRNGMTVDKMILRQDDLCAYQYHRLTDPRVR